MSASWNVGWGPAVRLGALVLGTALLGGTPPAAEARPEAPTLFCDALPEASECLGTMPACTLCHDAVGSRVRWNAFGIDVGRALEGPFRSGLAEALVLVGPEDSDRDGAANDEELAAGTLPGDPDSVPSVGRGAPVAPTDAYAIGRYDDAFAFRRMMTAFCGRSPDYDEMLALRSSASPRAHLHERLDACLDSRAWRREVLPRLADPIVRPLGGAGTCLAYYGNFEFDYDLFVWVLTDGRDARGLLTAQHHVVRGVDGRLAPYEPPGADPRVPAPRSRGSVPLCRNRYGQPVRDASGRVDELSFIGGQALLPRERAGLLTTQWSLWFNTMGAYLPRVTAAHAYRVFLGFDIAQYEGLFATPGEPLDVDGKGVAHPDCAACHATLDPLAYAFAPYWGGAGNPMLYLDAGVPPVHVGSYLPTRPLARSFPDAWTDRWAAESPTARLLGEPLPDDDPEAPTLTAWAARAAESDAFLRTLATRLFVHAVGRAPRGAEHRALATAWARMRDDGYAFDGLAHRLVDLEAFGAP